MKEETLFRQGLRSLGICFIHIPKITILSCERTRENDMTLEGIIFGGMGSISECAEMDRVAAGAVEMFMARYGA